jgi:hypothetical protein
LAEEAAASGLQPVVLTEWAPFIEAYAALGEWENAEKLAADVRLQGPMAEAMLCNLFERLAVTDSPDDLQQTALRLSMSDCSGG